MFAPIRLLNLLFYGGVGSLLAGAWTRWLLQDQLLATGAILLGAWVALVLYFQTQRAVRYF